MPKLCNKISTPNHPLGLGKLAKFFCKNELAIDIGFICILTLGDVNQQELILICVASPKVANPSTLVLLLRQVVLQKNFAYVKSSA